LEKSTTYHENSFSNELLPVTALEMHGWYPNRKDGDDQQSAEEKQT
jgi:hypothetical protein